MAKDAAGPDSPRPDTARPSRKGPPDTVYGAIDLGTNNCRMLLARKSPGGFRVIDAYSRIVRLGEGLLSSGRLSEPAMTRAIEALSVCADRVKRRNVTRLRAIATEACRAADNSDEFLERARAATGLELEIITAEEEARLAVQGSLDLLDPEMDAALVLDIGGGSTELCWVDLAEWRTRGGLKSGGRPPLRGWSTMPLGVVTLSDRFPEPSDPALRETWYQDMKACAAQHLRPPRGARRLRPVFNAGRAHLVGTSGTVTSVAGVHLNLERYVRDKVDGMWMSTAEAREACLRLAVQDRAGRARQGCIGDDRADLVLAGCAIYEAVMDAWPTERVRVGDRGLREGILLGLMRPRKRRGSRGRTRSRRGKAKS
ncbi:Ppx/GppA family phosphatase [Alkalicaulis satelles]|uniref:Ppx/GppA family phosphatase n=1 Tax=Alkalicaulis satelles TaxID=2609175 RepID=A0A5M6ZJ66_9PROT|nr:Ppx/GppA phosphatase family protein [Alkalicaulis satelles]KAA5804829.1 Ppx/GppA family phosphatase [Alkalicaulis satelles]